MSGHSRCKNILLAEPNFEKTYVVKEYFQSQNSFNNLFVVRNGKSFLELLNNLEKESIENLYIFMNLNMPFVHDALVEVNKDIKLRSIPIIIFTPLERDSILKYYDIHENCYITKSMDLLECLEYLQFYERQVTNELSVRTMQKYCL